MAAPDLTDLPELTISFLARDTASEYCTEFVSLLHPKFTAPHPRHPQFGAYELGASILPLPATYGEYWDAVGYYTRRKVRKAQKLGYAFSQIDRDACIDDLYEINTSMDSRQGMPMKEPYRNRPEPFGPLPDYPCGKHRLATYGVLREGRLLAYTWVYQVGEMCLFSSILGHGEHLGDGIMFMLIAGALEDLIPSAGTKYAMYNMHYSGTDGLRFFKEQMGFAPYIVHWKRGDETASLGARWRAFKLERAHDAMRKELIRANEAAAAARRPAPKRAPSGRTRAARVARFVRHPRAAARALKRRPS